MHVTAWRSEYIKRCMSQALSHGCAWALHSFHQTCKNIYHSQHEGVNIPIPQHACYRHCMAGAIQPPPCPQPSLLVPIYVHGRRDPRRMLRRDLGGWWTGSQWVIGHMQGTAARYPGWGEECTRARPAGEAASPVDEAARPRRVHCREDLLPGWQRIPGGF